MSPIGLIYDPHILRNACLNNGWTDLCEGHPLVGEMWIFESPDGKNTFRFRQHQAGWYNGSKCVEPDVRWNPSVTPTKKDEGDVREELFRLRAENEMLKNQLGKWF